MAQVVRVDGEKVGTISRGHARLEQQDYTSFVARDEYGRVQGEFKDYGDAVWALLDTADGDIYIQEEE